MAIYMKKLSDPIHEVPLRGRDDGRRPMSRGSTYSSVA